MEAIAKQLTGKSLDEIGRWVDEAKILCTCSTLLKGSNVKRYPHDGGWLVEGYDGRQWVYVHCWWCRYDWSLVKLIRRSINEI